MTDPKEKSATAGGSAGSCCSAASLTFAGQKRTIDRVTKLIRNDVKVNRVFSMFRAEIERNNDPGEAALMILAMLAADPVESEKLIRAIRELRDRSYEASY